MSHERREALHLDRLRYKIGPQTPPTGGHVLEDLPLDQRDRVPQGPAFRSAQESPRSSNLKGTFQRDAELPRNNKPRELRYTFDKEPDPRLNRISPFPETFAYFPTWKEKVISSLHALGSRARTLRDILMCCATGIDQSCTPMGKLTPCSLLT